VSDERPPLRVAIIGTGNIGTDLMIKVGRSPLLALVGVAGIDPASEGLRRAREEHTAAHVTDQGLEALLDEVDEIDLAFDATSAGAHPAHARLLAARGIRSVDLTPAALGPAIVPPVNLDAHREAMEVNLVTCGAQATIPIVAAIRRVTPVAYAETVSTVASRSAGPGTRANIDEFTQATAWALESVGGASAAKAIIILNPADPPMIMRDTIFCAVPPDADRDAIVQSVVAMERAVQEYVPGYRLLQEPQVDDPSPATQGQTKVSIFVEVEGAGDYLPPYAGNLDIMTAAATQVGENIARTVGG
jgi:acetaldehyde dehydrogenase